MRDCRIHVPVSLASKLTSKPTSESATHSECREGNQGADFIGSDKLCTTPEESCAKRLNPQVTHPASEQPLSSPREVMYKLVNHVIKAQQQSTHNLLLHIPLS